MPLPKIFNMCYIFRIFYLGGGSGHEPFAIGFVGRGALTASVVGGIFASPTSHTIINAINTCSSSPINDGDCRESGVYSSGDSRGCSDGALLVVTNYTGVLTYNLS